MNTFIHTLHKHFIWVYRFTTLLIVTRVIPSSRYMLIAFALVVGMDLLLTYYINRKFVAKDFIPLAIYGGILIVFAQFYLIL